MLTPHHLVSLGYDKIPVIEKISGLSFVEKDSHIELVTPWYEIRDILEYMSCVEYSKCRLLSLPTGRALGSVNIVPARYDSAALVFFAQATLDNLAIWFNKRYTFGLKGNSISFYKPVIKPRLLEQDTDYGTTLDEYAEFINRLNTYRMEWLHRVAGGAQIYSDKSPSDPSANTSIQVPIDPEIPSLKSNPRQYGKRINMTKSRNKGKWLMPIDEFASYIQSNTKNLLLKLLSTSIKEES